MSACVDFSNGSFISKAKVKGKRIVETTSPRTANAETAASTGQRPKPNRQGRPKDGFDALLEPFYQGKSLADPIDTAKVYGRAFIITSVA